MPAALWVSTTIVYFSIVQLEIDSMLFPLFYCSDQVRTGHDLGDPAKRQTPQGRDRYLSASAICIIRAIMHSAFIWVSCNNENAIETLAELVHPTIPPQNLPEYFWMHLERDLGDLCKITSRGIEECSMIIHLVLKDVLTKKPPTGKISPAVLYNLCDPILVLQQDLLWYMLLYYCWL